MIMYDKLFENAKNLPTIIKNCELLPAEERNEAAAVAVSLQQSLYALLALIGDCYYTVESSDSLNDRRGAEKLSAIAEQTMDVIENEVNRIILAFSALSEESEIIE